MWSGSDEGRRAGRPSVSMYQAAKLTTQGRMQSIRALASFQADPVERKRLNDLSERLSGCASQLSVSLLEGDFLVRAEWCGLWRLCAGCALRRAQEYRRKYGARLWWSLYEDERLSPWVFTLTVKDGPDLGERVRHLRTAFKRLDMRRSNALKGRSVGDSEWSKVAGAVWAFEFKRGENSKLWHPHIHGVVLSAVPLSVKRLSDEWSGLTGDSHRVDVYRMWVKTGPGKRDREDWSRERFGLQGRHLAGALAEVLKYSTQDGPAGSELDAADLVEANAVGADSRLIECSGVVRKAWSFWPSCARPAYDAVARVPAGVHVWSDDGYELEREATMERDVRSWESVSEGDERMRLERLYKRTGFYKTPGHKRRMAQKYGRSKR